MENLSLGVNTSIAFIAALGAALAVGTLVLNQPVEQALMNSAGIAIGAAIGFVIGKSIAR